ncbi:MAG: hypothetical protein JW938_07545 [Candidatus Omnitrophica bacterium]|nr:hypothetical protein [Candidatus Omnitrophota bacterium]
MYDLVFEVLRRLQSSKVLSSMILIGSWCMHFYKYYFTSDEYVGAIRTLDIDFLVSTPLNVKIEVDIPNMLHDLGFIVRFSGDKGYIKLVHPDLIVEFLVAERGPGTDAPVKFPQLGINAVALRYLDFLAEHVIIINIEGLKIRIPHPAAYALHKFIVFGRRKKKDKKERDLEGALRVFRALIADKKKKDIKRIFLTMHKKWQKTVVSNLRGAGEDEIARFLEDFMLH